MWLSCGTPLPVVSVCWVLTAGHMFGTRISEEITLSSVSCYKSSSQQGTAPFWFIWWIRPYTVNDYKIMMIHLICLSHRSRVLYSYCFTWHCDNVAIGIICVLDDCIIGLPLHLTSYWICKFIRVAIADLTGCDYTELQITDVARRNALHVYVCMYV